MKNPAVDGTGSMQMFGTANTAQYVIAPPVVDQLQQKSTPIDLYKVAYFRDNSDYDELLTTLLSKVASMQSQLRSR
ncbi:MAG: hypothetical protein K2W95_08375 [Candidatus Obscuribacterales bacterium]|nr:hypothetical protein [Candidatus Obscuribacterales bacterium]